MGVSFSSELMNRTGRSFYIWFDMDTTSHYIDLSTTVYSSPRQQKYGRRIRFLTLHSRIFGDNTGDCNDGGVDHKSTIMNAGATIPRNEDLR